MIAQILEMLALWIQGVISSVGYIGVAGLMAIESACIPLPSEVIMPFAGSLIPSGRFTLFGAGLAGAIGCVIGSIPAYYAGSLGGRPLILRYGRYILLSHEHLNWADKFFAKSGDIAVFIARLLPVVRTFIAFPAGVAKCLWGNLSSIPLQVASLVHRPRLDWNEAGRAHRRAQTVVPPVRRGDCRSRPGVCGLVRQRELKARRQSNIINYLRIIALVVHYPSDEIA